MNIVLGTAQFGLQYGVTNCHDIVSDDELAAILDLAERSGIQGLDTAKGYGNAQARLAKFLPRHEFCVTSKIAVGDVTTGLAESIHSQLNSILSDLKTEKIDLILIHDAEGMEPKTWRDVQHVLNECVSQNIVGDYGLSLYTVNTSKQLIEKDPCVVQIPISLFNDEFVRTQELHRLKTLGCRIQVRSVFHQGLALSETWPDRFHQYEDLRATYFSTLECLSATPLAACLGFIKSLNAVDDVVLGITSIDELKDIISTVSDEKAMQLSPDLLRPYSDEVFRNPAMWSSL